MTKQKLLRPKFYVYRYADGYYTTRCLRSTDPEDVDSPFVLMPRKDPAAFAAMIAYAQCCEPKLAAEILQWLHRIAEAPPLFGTQGIRNYSYKRAECLKEI